MSMTPDFGETADRRRRSALAFWGAEPAGRDYWEDFSSFSGWIANSQSPLPLGPSGAVCQGPWIVDANHAPPGAGYLHLLMHIHTLEKRLHAPYAKASGMYPEEFLQKRQHAFIHGGYSRNLTNARIRVHLRGNLQARGAKLSVLVQGDKCGSGPRGNWILTGQEFRVTPEFSHQEVVLVPDAAQWTYMGSRHDLSKMYGYVPIADVLADVNVSFIFVLFPLCIEPFCQIDDKHKAWAGQDYDVRQDLLPEGAVEFKSVWFKYAQDGLEAGGPR